MQVYTSVLIYEFCQLFSWLDRVLFGLHSCRIVHREHCAVGTSGRDVLLRHLIYRFAIGLDTAWAVYLDQNILLVLRLRTVMGCLHDRANIEQLARRSMVISMLIRRAGGL